jgi:hypothetical protein
MLQVEALSDAAQLDLRVAAHQLEGDLFAAIADGEVNLAEAPSADAALQRETIQGSLS